MKSKIFITALALLLGFSFYLLFKKEIETRKQSKMIATLIEQSGKNEVINHYYRDSVEHVVFREKIVSSTNEKKIAIGKAYADSLEKALKISIEKIDQVSKINALLVAKLQLQSFIQPNGDKVLYHKDKYLDLRYYPQTDSVNFSYNIKLNEARYKERKWLLGRTSYYIDVFSDDPRVKINGLNAYRIRGQPPSHWGIGISAGYGLSLNKGILQATPVFGVGVNYNVINF
ncbi:DUF6808 domain-containing protein [Riemerella columbipharyngis]|uniref:Uncharacterized protein n=1 Tax=Riemerella columbipharyngis TaxID=1071918 RepID=A0A1G7FP09_9FLAO|nr:hypothetical protein [Riemerella columbipharyngis]SDE77642.1 hypothetical protein SAMN05421544_1257 [Riemerella columbipharyngis]